METTVVPGFRVLGFSALPGFRALKAGDGAWSVHKTLFGFKVPTLQSNESLLFKINYCKQYIVREGLRLTTYVD